MKYTCPCCGYKTLDEKPPGTYAICSICYWEDDGVQYDDVDYEEERKKKFPPAGGSSSGTSASNSI